MPAGVNSGVRLDNNLLNLKQVPIAKIRPEIEMLLVQGEEYVSVYQTVRDQVVFTTKRIIVVNVQGITGKKVAYMSYPYSRVQNFAVETTGVLDIDCELLIFFVSGLTLQLDFKDNVDIKEISQLLASYVL